MQVGVIVKRENIKFRLSSRKRIFCRKGTRLTNLYKKDNKPT
ncbi:MAG: hypothetical protein JWR18_1189 [Segetibacter sp.]|nr:hypothetical protein [Segetibacter sp.]